MAEKKTLVVYAAAYETAEAALADLEVLKQLKDELTGSYDAAVIGQQNGNAHVIKRVDRPHIRVIPEWFGGGVLPRKELHGAAEELPANHAVLIAVGEPANAEGLNKALAGAVKVVKRTVDAANGEITSELQEALKEANMSSTETRGDQASSGAGTAQVDMHLEVDVIPVSDVDRAKDFYQRLGWRFDDDVSPLDGLRIVQFTPPGSGTSVTFGTGLTAATPGSALATLTVSDIEASHNELVGRGFDTTEIWHGPPFPPEARLAGPDPERTSYQSFFSFNDPDGNMWIVQEVTTRLPGRV
jgi:catechol 2,3-dioxygenase-like lactoylglutathione lyase family enzyme